MERSNTNIMLEIVSKNDISNLNILQTTESDKEEILNILSEEFDFMTKEEISYEIEDVDYSISLKAINNEKKIVGVLLFQKTDIFDFLKRIKKEIKLNYNTEYFKNKSGISGTAFVIDKKYRGTKLNKLFIERAHTIISNYDYVMSEVMEDLKTHNYWKRMGFKEFGIFEIAVGNYITYVYVYDKNL